MHLSRYLFFLIFVCTSFSACTAYQPYSVQHRDTVTRPPTPPPVRRTPIVKAAEFNIYRALSNDRVLFVLPTKLLVTNSHSRNVQAISFERNDGTHLFFIANLSPGPKLLETARDLLARQGIDYDRLAYYPADVLHVRPGTDPRDPATLRVTVVTGRPSSSAPFSVLTAIQVAGRSNILSFKRLVEKNGFILFGYCDLVTHRQDAVNADPVSIQIIIRSTVVTTHTT